MGGKFPLLTKANLKFFHDAGKRTEHDISVIVKFIEKCDQLEEINFCYDNSDLQAFMLHLDLKERINGTF